LQVKLLRVIQEGVLEKVGDEKSSAINVRIISATNLDIKSELQKGRFREDLYYRLNVIPIMLPPLRNRKIDIPHLANHFLKENKTEQHHHPTEISSDAMALMMDYNWPGNVRELENVIRFAVVKSKLSQILPEDLPLELYQPANTDSPKPSKGPNKKLQLETVRHILKETGGNKVKTAKKLGVGRATLYRFLKDNPELVS
jgi:sigma-54 dependent transcriptional regulator, acetoin dehydrogenase operon transcriptional activator AcoR